MASRFVGGARRGLVVFAVVPAVAALGACGDDGPAEPSTGLPNPASEFCVEQGGEVDIVTEADGQVGYCVLPDGTRVEEWDYFRANSTTTEP